MLWKNELPSEIPVETAPAAKEVAVEMAPAASEVAVETMPPTREVTELKTLSN